jgi:hypothetical protein
MPSWRYIALIIILKRPSCIIHYNENAPLALPEHTEAERELMRWRVIPVNLDQKVHKTLTLKS